MSMHPIARRQHLEVLAGFVSVFAVAALVNAIGLILTGQPSILASIVLLVAVGLCWLLWRSWRRGV